MLNTVSAAALMAVLATPTAAITAVLATPALTIMAVLATPAHAGDTVRLAAASEGGGYDAAMKALASQLKKRKFLPEITNYAGSEDIAAAICAGEADFGPIQIDAYRNAVKSGCDLQALGVYGVETTHLLFPPDSDVDELDDLGKGDKVLVGEIGSGSALTFETMVSIERGEHGNKSSWSEVTVVHKDHELAEAELFAGGVKAVFLVSTLDHRMLNELLEGGWVAGNVYDKDINDLEFNGSELYKSVDTDYPGQFWDSSTYEVRTVYVASPGFRDENKDAFKVINRVKGNLRRSN